MEGAGRKKETVGELFDIQCVLDLKRWASEAKVFFETKWGRWRGALANLVPKIAHLQNRTPVCRALNMDLQLVNLMSKFALPLFFGSNQLVTKVMHLPNRVPKVT